MPRRKRSKTIDLGSLAPGMHTEEIDLTSFTDALMFVTLPSSPTSSSAKFLSQASPTPAGSDADWYDVHSAASYASFGANRDQIVVNTVPALLGNPEPRHQVVSIATSYDVGSSFGNDFMTSNFPLPSRIRIESAGNNETMPNIKVQMHRSVG